LREALFAPTKALRITNSENPIDERITAIKEKKENEQKRKEVKRRKMGDK